MGDGNRALISELTIPQPQSPAPQGQTACIRAHSERQAMDWGLVLASQGIETTLRFSPEEPIWLLEVSTGDLERARSAIVTYRAENKYRSRRQRQQESLPPRPVFVHWGSILWATVLAAMHTIASSLYPAVGAWGDLDSRRFAAGEWWRCITAVTLHANLGHLASNLAVGVLVLGLAMSQAGAGLLLFLSFTSAVLANVAGWGLRSEPFIGLGASGMVMAALGILCGLGLMDSSGWRNPRQGRLLAAYGGLGLFLLLGASPAPEVDWLVHLLGFCFGLGFGCLAGLGLRRGKPNPEIDIYSGTVAVATLAAAWIAAIRK